MEITSKTEQRKPVGFKQLATQEQEEKTERENVGKQAICLVLNQTVRFLNGLFSRSVLTQNEMGVCPASDGGCHFEERTALPPPA